MSGWSLRKSLNLDREAGSKKGKQRRKDPEVKEERKSKVNKSKVRIKVQLAPVILTGQ